jgi:hypothetical protein
MDESVTQELLCAQDETQESLSRLENFSCELLDAVPKKSTGKPASPLHAELVLRLRREFEAREVPIKLAMKEAGSSEQQLRNWRKGASPKLVTLERLAKRLEIPPEVLLGWSERIASGPSALVQPNTLGLIHAIEAWADAAGIKRPTEDNEFFDGLVALWNEYRRRVAQRQ